MFFPENKPRGGIETIIMLVYCGSNPLILSSNGTSKWLFVGLNLTIIRGFFYKWVHNIVSIGTISII